MKVSESRRQVWADTSSMDVKITPELQADRPTYSDTEQGYDTLSVVMS